MENRTHMQISTAPLDAQAIVQEVLAADCGAVATFIGVVRDHHAGRAVEYLEYEAYPEMAEETLCQIGQEMRERWPALRHVTIVHRIGRQYVGEISVVIAASAGHRVGIFDAVQYAIERIKQIVPIWKKEVGPDGATWIEGPESQRPSAG